MAHRRKPTALKVIAGTTRPDRAPLADPIILPLVADAPPAPDWLPNAHAVKEWDRLAAILHVNGILTVPALGALGQLCALHGALVQAWAAGLAPTAALMAQHRALSGDFGLTPAMQAKVRAPSGPAPRNRFHTNGRPR